MLAFLKIDKEIRMTKAELIELVAKNTNGELSKKASGEIIDTLFEAVAKSIKKEKKFSYPGFRTFTVRARKARTGVNPRTGEQIKIKASKTVGFKPAKAFKETL
jgi:DNA-binding protein HU-beta